jgi:diguanylate cyclase (GGDEF)-like protein
VLELTQSVFWSLLSSSHEIALNLLGILAQRLRSSNGEVARGRRLADQYKRHASIDALTGLHNRRWLDEVLPRQVLRAEMQGEALSVLMIDIDHFKRFNDQWGHAAGDFVLFGVSKLLQARLRPTDLVARYGGEELTAILPRTDVRGAEVAADRVRRAIAFTPFEMPAGDVLPNVTVSIGIAESRAGIGAPGLLASADRALYRAKRNGRDRVERE